MITPFNTGPAPKILGNPSETRLVYTYLGSELMPERSLLGGRQGSSGIKGVLTSLEYADGRYTAQAILGDVRCHAALIAAAGKQDIGYASPPNFDCEYGVIITNTGTDRTRALICHGTRRSLSQGRFDPTEPIVLNDTALRLAAVTAQIARTIRRGWHEQGDNPIHAQEHEGNFSLPEATSIDVIHCR